MGALACADGIINIKDVSMIGPIGKNTLGISFRSARYHSSQSKRFIFQQHHLLIGQKEVHKLVVLSLMFLLAFTVPSVFDLKTSSQYTTQSASSRINFLTYQVLGEIDFQKYHTSNETISILQTLQSTYPMLIQTYVIGHSYEGKQIWAAEITNQLTGAALTKPAMLYVGPHHGNEVIGKEIALYYIWYLLINYGVNENVTQILDEKTIYVIPCVNVDGNDWTLKGLDQRVNSRPMDEDGDGLLDEDPGEDINGDGRITDMRKWNETTNNWDYWLEGIDNDLDGLCNEDWIGGVDLNRNYPVGWLNYSGHGQYPFSEPETATVRDFVLSHPNIATAYETHSGANCLIYPWAYTSTPSPDDTLYTTLKTKYEKLTGYAYHFIGGCHGTSDDWIYGTQSAIDFIMELFGQGFYPGGGTQFEKDYPDVNVPWQNFSHPQLGNVQIGGTWVFRLYNPPESEIEQRALKVLSMLIDLAEITPKIEITQLEAAQENGVGKEGLFNISATIANVGFLDTATLQAIQTHTNKPVNVTLSFSGNVKLVNGNQTVSFTVIKGNKAVNAQWQIRITGDGYAWVNVTVVSAKGGVDEAYVFFNLPSSASMPRTRSTVE